MVLDVVLVKVPVNVVVPVNDVVVVKLLTRTVTLNCVGPLNRMNC